jgi:hypothetical protein
VHALSIISTVGNQWIFWTPLNSITNSHFMSVLIGAKVQSFFFFFLILLK